MRKFGLAGALEEEVLGKGSGVAARGASERGERVTERRIRPDGAKEKGNEGDIDGDSEWDKERDKCFR